MIITLARRASPAPRFIPTTSQSQCEPDKPDGPSQTIPSILPTPELVDACRPAPQRTWESAYNHSSLQFSADVDSEWSTFIQRTPRPRKALKDMITSSAKFHLPIRSRGMSSMTEPHEERMEKRPRITLYRPPPRTATVDTADLEGRYACVRDTMRKVSIVDNRDVCSPSRFQVAGADAKTMAVASERVGGDVGCPWAAQLRCSICRRKCCSGGRNPRLAWDRNGVPLTALLFVLSM
jgi:hypothetical protein